MNRDRSIDAVRAYAICGVVAGHWLVTGLVTGPDGGLRPASPLAAIPQAAPATWLLQTLGLFFFAGGFAATRPATPSPATPSPATPSPATPSPATPSPCRAWPGCGPGRSGAGFAALARVAGRVVWRRSGLRRLAGPVALVGAGLGSVLAAGAAIGVPATTLRTVFSLVIDPLWFLLPYTALSALTRPLTHSSARTLLAAGTGAVALVAAADAHVIPGVVAVPAAWAVPWLFGVAVARGHLSRRRAGALLAAGGAAALAFLITVGHYPLSAVGVPGQSRSNLSPPSLAAVALGTTQIGVFLLLRPLLARTGGAPRLNRAALRIYLSHQSVLLVTALLLPRAPGLIGAPDTLVRVTQRAAWIPIFALVTATVVGLWRRRGRRHHRPAFLKWRLTSTLIDGPVARNDLRR